MLQIPYAIPAVAGLAFIIILFFGARMPRRGAEVGIAAMAISTIAAIVLNVQWVTSNGVPVHLDFRWFSYGTTPVEASVVVDGLSVLLLLIVTIISLVVQIFSVPYMKNDSRFTHFFAVLTLFSGAMEWFVMSGNTLQMIFGWEVMALCSFLLIGHWWEEKHNVNAAMKAFLTTRASDIGLFVGVAVLFFAAGKTFNVDALNNAAAGGRIEHTTLVVGSVALFIAVIGKSAQFPLHTWLPDAMAGPTPMSALIHAATMVVAGVFLLARLFPTFNAAFGLTDGTVNVIAIIGAITIIIAGLLAFVQRDIKKVLSYSTVAQLGYMVMAIGVGAVVAAMFHLFVHAFSKALLFLASGSISHSVHGFDLEDDMGDLRKDLPLTHISFAIGTLCLIGVIPFAGFWSKEQIAATAHANGYDVFVWVSIIGSVLTALYMTRTYYLIFWGARRGPSVIREAPRSMTVPCLVLAVLALLAGWVALPFFDYNPFLSWLYPGAAMALPDGSPLSIAAEIAIPIVGLGLAVLAFSTGIGPRSLARKSTLARAVYRVLSQRYYLDHLYDLVFVRGIRRGLSLLVHWVDHNVIDSVVDASGRFSVSLGRLVNGFFDSRIVDGVVRETGTAAYGAGGILGKSQNGQIQRYVATAVITVALIIAAIAVWA